MISPLQIRNVLEVDPGLFNGNYFFKTHTHLEAYIKRVMLIGLRLRGVQYENSVKIVESTYITTANLIGIVLWLVDRSGKNKKDILVDLENKYPDFFALKNLVLMFSAIYRNRLAHGTIAELHDQSLIGLLCHVNRSFFLAFEKLLTSEYGHSAFNKPGDWGALPGFPESIDKTVKRLSLGSIVKAPMTVVDVKNILSVTTYAIK